MGLGLWLRAAVSPSPNRIGPTTSSIPFDTTLVDGSGLVFYFKVALTILHGTML
ncbi:hypothetical protein ACXR0O_08045 [Verrucomicrobiota bacterium sgz303538]